uniref:Putative secreted protein n=1 Tax=Ixodes ricinus TaxID=34613 RepID=A0A147BAU1_IXORI
MRPPAERRISCFFFYFLPPVKGVHSVPARRGMRRGRKGQFSEGGRTDILGSGSEHDVRDREVICRNRRPGDAVLDAPLSSDSQPSFLYWRIPPRRTR